MIEAGGLTLDLGAINWFAVIVSVIFAMAFGTVYYLPQTVGRYWMEALGITVEEIGARGNQAQAMGVAVIGAIVSVISIAILIQLADAYSFIGGLFIGVLAAVGLVLAPMGTRYIFEGRPLKLYIVNGVENSVSLIVISLILALWK